MRNPHFVSRRFPSMLLKYICPMLGLFVVFFAGSVHAAETDDEQVLSFFMSVEDSFRRMQIPDIMKYIHKDFSYIMTYSTDGIFSFLVSDSKKYRESLGSFFKSKPVIHEYEIGVESIQRTGEDIMVLARITSVVELNGIINSCDASSNYYVQYANGGFLIRDVRGDATCSNTRTDQR